ncbi:hypothetical protein GCM10011415_36310 [Salipiger pallidus]|uniref:Transketolase-like pyrimidine-binding domain-containing protein n=1 Tax=Salipiger pallidus TaxID=1775170 RepID=A0A8J3EI20_9RHOB|nr:hypothetical protein GCM10011415_36310 [Salipiger pallidus]
MGVTYAMSEDSIGPGGSGTIHRPVAHLASLRVILNLTVFHPTGLVETLEVWDVVLHPPPSSPKGERAGGLPPARTTHSAGFVGDAAGETPGGGVGSAP